MKTLLILPVVALSGCSAMEAISDNAHLFFATSVDSFTEVGGSEALVAVVNEPGILTVANVAVALIAALTGGTAAVIANGKKKTAK